MGRTRPVEHDALWAWIGKHADARSGRSSPRPDLNRGTTTGGGAIGGIASLVVLAVVLGGLWWGFTGGRHEGPAHLAQWEQQREAARAEDFGRARPGNALR